MTISLLLSTFSELPYSLREQVIGYAESVKAALPRIFADSGIRPTDELVSQMVYLAGIRKFYGLVASCYWALDNSSSLLQSQNVTQIRIGALEFSRGGEIHRTLKNALEAIESVLERENAKELIEFSYVELARRLEADGHQ